jgi:hypothetical protein
LELQTDDIEFDAYWSFRTELVLGQESDELEDEFFFLARFGSNSVLIIPSGKKNSNIFGTHECIQKMKIASF